METLQLKHICGYLPYGLKVSKIHKLHAGSGIGNINQVISAVNSGKLQYRPRLRPLSSLTKEIEHNGEKFVPIVEINKVHTLEFEDGLFNDYVSDGWGSEWLPFSVIQRLYEWHFDIFWLIDKNLAINLEEI